MSSFTAPLDVRKLEGDYWQTLRAFVYYAGEEGSDESYEVSAGFVTDFASIPRFLWSLVGHPAQEYVQAAVLHDWLYKTGIVSRVRSDALFLEAMKVLGCTRYQRTMLYSGVRVGGWAAWRKHRKRQKEKGLNGNNQK